MKKRIQILTVRTVGVLLLSYSVKAARPQFVQAYSIDTVIKILYVQKNKDSNINKGNCCPAVLNESYIKTMPGSERAALGLISTFIADDCEWEDYKTRINLNCRITTLLGLGHQCSETQLGFLQHWFRNDPTTLKKLVQDSCAKTPPGANRQYSFSKIILTKRNNRELIITYNAIGLSLRRATSWEWQEVLTFKTGANETLYLVKRTGKKLWEESDSE
jgi:hypothetical protein